MTVPPPAIAGPAAPAPGTTRPGRPGLRSRPVTDRRRAPVGPGADVIARLRGAGYPLGTGPVAVIGGREIVVAIEPVSSLLGAPRVSGARLDLRSFERRDGEVRLRAGGLGGRLIDVPRDGRRREVTEPADSHHGDAL